VSAVDVGTGRAYNNGAATITVSGGATGGKAISSYTATSSPGSFTATSGSPLTVTGLQSATAYTFSVTATNANGTSTSTTSGSITATTVPQTPTITSATRSSNTVVSIDFTGATGGKTLTAVTATSSPSVSITSAGTSSPMTATATYTEGQSYTFTITATNANGTSGSSAASGAVTPFPSPTLSAWSASTNYPFNNLSSRTGDSTGSLFYIGTGIESGIPSNPMFYWNGSAWTQRYYGQNVYFPSMGRFDTSTLIGIGGETSGNPTSNVYHSTSGGSFTAGTAFAGGGVVSGISVRVSGGFYADMGSQGTAAYYCTTAGGAWTSATASPIGGSRKGADFNLSEAYMTGNNATNFYKLTSASGSWSVSTANPSATGQIPSPFLYNINNSRLLYHPNTTNGTLNTYLFNGTAFTASTSLPSGFNTRNWQGGAVGTTISALNSESSAYVAHYRATLS
jgi:hypothetical protein